MMERMERMERMVRLLVGAAVVCGLMLGSGFEAAAAPAFKYVGAKKCRTCHKKELIGNQFGVWKEARHSKAFKTLKGDKAIEFAKEKGIVGPPSEADECLKCHATASGLGPEDFAKKPLLLTDGVQCESCHGPGSAYRKKKIMADHDKSVEKGLVMPDSETCLTCHNDESPSWDPAKYTLADGTTAGFDFDQAAEEIKHPIPEDVKGKYIEIEKQRKKERKAAGRGGDEEEEDEED